ncbi:MAG: CHRD domain-containing protein [Labilithrix sp.]
MKTSLFLSTAITALLVAGAASAEKKTYAALDMAGDHEIPAVESGATAKAILTFDTTTKKLCGKITPTPSTFKATSASLHVGDDKAADGDKYVDLNTDGFTGEVKINVTLDDEAQVTKLTTGDSYINVFTEANKDGELRDQLVEDDTQPEQACDDATEEDAGASSSGGSSSGSGTGTGTGGGDGGAKSSSSGSAAAADSTDDGGCNTTGSSSGNALALLAGLGIVVAAASRKRKKA